MDDLAAFINARLGEDEAAANEVHLPRKCGSVDRDGDFDPDPVWCGCGYPARVLREVAAKRRILDDYRITANACRNVTGPDIDSPGYRAMCAGRDALKSCVTQMAAVWSDHPDYRQAWKP